MLNSNNSRPLNSNVALSNQGFISDELSPPPSYSSIFPFKTDSNDSSSNLKIYSITTTPETIHINTSMDTNTLAANAVNLEPISYDELFQINNTSSNLTSALTNCSSRYNNNNNSVNSQTSALLSATSMSPSNNLAKQIRIHFIRSYLISHFSFIIITSLITITLQIVLMSNEAKLSQIGCGIWAGLTNLATLIVSIATIKYAKIWLLLSAIMIHIVCILFSLGGMIVINSIAATKYYICETKLKIETKQLSIEKEIICSQIYMKYCNIGLIVIGGICILFFLNFFFKLVNVFNYIHSVPPSQPQAPSTHLLNQQRHQFRT